MPSEALRAGGFKTNLNRFTRWRKLFRPLRLNQPCFSPRFRALAPFSAFSAIHAVKQFYFNYFSAPPRGTSPSFRFFECWGHESNGCVQPYLQRRICTFSSGEKAGMRASIPPPTAPTPSIHFREDAGTPPGNAFFHNSSFILHNFLSSPRLRVELLRLSGFLNAGAMNRMVSFSLTCNSESAPSPRGRRPG
jgi:hypothetical protein